jgi:hypothetical protein
MSITYKGVREAFSRTVTVDGRPLDPRLDLCNLSAEGFDWGNDSVASAQLALAILADHAGDETARRLFEDFNLAVIARLPPKRWTLSRGDIDHALAVIETTGAWRLR